MEIRTSTPEGARVVRTASAKVVIEECEEISSACQCTWAVEVFGEGGAGDGGVRAQARIVRGVREGGGEVLRAWRIAAPMPRLAPVIIIVVWGAIFRGWCGLVVEVCGVVVWEMVGWL